MHIFQAISLSIFHALFSFVSFSFSAKEKEMVGTNGLEPSTSRLSGVRSNHLSYAPGLVEMRRIELLTPCLQSRCSPSWATPPLPYFFFFQSSVFFPVSSKLNNVFLYFPTLPSHWPLEFKHFCLLLLRKEVIQPHLPIRLPCYDFTPVINPTLDGVLPKVRRPALGVTDSHGVTGGVYKARERIHRSMLICDY